MAKGQDNGTTILLGLEGYKVGDVWEEGKVIAKTKIKGKQKCHHCGSAKLYSHGECKPRKGSTPHLEERQKGLPRIALPAVEVQ